MADAIKEAFGRRLPLEPSNQVSAAPSAPSTAEVKALAEKVRRVEDDFVKQNSPAAAQAMLQMQAAILALSNKMELFLNGAMVDGQSIVVNALAKHRESVSKAQIYARIADNVVEEEQAIRAANGLSPHLTEEVIQQLAEKLKKAAVQHDAWTKAFYVFCKDSGFDMGKISPDCGESLVEEAFRR